VRYRAVFFDAGGTLVHPYPSFPELFTTVVNDGGHHVDQEALRRGLERVSERFTRAAETRELWSTPAERSKAFWLELYAALLEQLGIGPGDGLAERLYETFTDLSSYRLFPDVRSTLVRLERAGLKLAVVSNFEEWLERLLESLDVVRFFDVRVISGVEGYEKPDPRLFRLALERTGLVPEQAVYVGDLPMFDIEPAEAIGMLGVLIDRQNRYPDHGGIRIGTLEELPEIIGVAG
jgi:putative hydrolase of the HAD superfamily